LNVASKRVGAGVAIGLLACVLYTLPAQAALFDFSFSGTDVSGSGQFVASGAGPTFNVTDVTGTIVDTDLSPTSYVIQGGTSAYAGSDNLLFFPAAITPSNSTPAFVDFGGISFHTDAGIDFNFGGNSQTGPFEYVLNDSGRNPGGYAGVVGSTPILFSVVAGVPEPSTWAMMILGFAGIGFVGYRRSPKSTLALNAA
jgi:hypothetical protein